MRKKKNSDTQTATAVNSDSVYARDCTDAYNADIADLVQQIRCRCNENKIPYFMSFGVKMNERGTYDGDGGLVSSALLPEIIGIPSNDPRFARMINVLHGFQTVLRDDDAFDVDNDPCLVDDEDAI